MPRSASEILAQEFLRARAKVLEIAAFQDRLGEADGEVGGDPQAELLRRGYAILADDRGDKAARVQLLFSREYDEAWRQQFGI